MNDLEKLTNLVIVKDNFECLYFKDFKRELILFIPDEIYMANIDKLSPDTDLVKTAFDRSVKHSIHVEREVKRLNLLTPVEVLKSIHDLHITSSTQISYITDISSILGLRNELFDTENFINAFLRKGQKETLTTYTVDGVDYTFRDRC